MKHKCFNIQYLFQVHLLEDNDDLIEQLGLMENVVNNNDIPVPPPLPPLPPIPMDDDIE